MIDRLPYQLTEGVTATREGLVFEGEAMWKREAFPNHGWRLVGWSEASEVLTYREGKPGVVAAFTLRGPSREILAVAADGRPAGDPALSEVAFLFVGGRTESFLVLHWCIHNLTGVTTNG